MGLMDLKDRNPTVGLAFKIVIPRNGGGIPGAGHPEGQRQGFDVDSGSRGCIFTFFPLVDMGELAVMGADTKY